ncbi:hypothetical protein [Porphyromonas levii]|uniref:hypothetical protein n=1 Tax=Porphyromonas levii TaxID=28114 RepID=UPI0010710253|nr:hypothetical protein [Porphyromonas levii]MBR8703956.1 hypothetical protein [Porphyromonas levii]MBR8729680.1 hypothetical protein [Porphyromonas levii]MBR8759204.1 hypothetical protein [Porphyromonas levii]MBR8764073.1 hypothetical protein [Porphyromonas levii]MBR8770638.1 hypothetical protein [Porphyromonas levii]
MRELNSFELSNLLGGSASSANCVSRLQGEANTHRDSGNQEFENAYWDDWADRWDECVASLN